LLLLLLLLQTFYSCFNGGTQGSTGSRRCDTYRSSTNASQPLSCPAQFLDFCFAFWGNNGVFWDGGQAQ
jgi:hypothetical protein